LFRDSAVLLAVLFSFAGGGATQPADLDPKKSLDRADLLIGQGKLDEAVALLEHLRQRQPPPLGIEARLAKAYYQKRDFRLAIGHFKLRSSRIPKTSKPPNCWDCRCIR